MKVLLFTHKSDIDGMGCAVLAKLAFSDVKYVLCETFNLKDEIKKFYDDGTIYNYDKVFVTDLSLEDDMLIKLATDKALENKFFIFDHHKTSLEKIPDKYSFITIRISDENGLCSGTSLFYEYLISNNLIDKDDKSIDEFQELTRRYDTWEWKNRYNDEVPHELSLLFDSVGCDGYIELMCQKLLEKNKHFSFNKLEVMLINNKINQVREKVLNYSKKVYYKEVFGLKAGIVFIDYEYRNDLAEYFKQNNFDMDFAMLISLDNGTISYRAVKDDVNVRMVAEALDGKGHDKAASSPISDSNKQELIKILTLK